MSNPVLEKLDILIEDCEAQLYGLKHRNDINWDCYSPENWENMLENLNYIKERLL